MQPSKLQQHHAFHNLQIIGQHAKCQLHKAQTSTQEQSQTEGKKDNERQQAVMLLAPSLLLSAYRSQKEDVTLKSPTLAKLGTR
jgi:hypothetical protein